MKNKLIASGVVIGLVLLALAFSQMQSEPEVGFQDQVRRQKDKGPVIGFCVDTMSIERWSKDRDIFKAKAEELGYQVDVVNAYEDSSTQVQQIQDFIDRQVAAIVIIAFNKDALSDVINQAKKEGIIVVAYDRLISQAPIDAYVSFDNIKVGRLMGEALLESVPEGNYIIINGSPKDNNASLFREGYLGVLKEAIEKGKIQILDEVWAEDWREKVAYDAVLMQLEKNNQVDAILCANDNLAGGAISGLAEYGLAKEVPVVGHDADIGACQRIVEGRQLMTVYKPIRNLAEGAAVIVDHLIKQDPLIIDEWIDNGNASIPYFKFDVLAVNEKNMEETIIKDLFHAEEDIYRHVK